MIKRMKNRLKNFDTALELMNRVKLEKDEFEQLKHDVNKDRAISVFNDMKLLLDSTVYQFEERLSSERDQRNQTYQSLVNSQSREM